MIRKPIVATFRLDPATKDGIARAITYSRYKSATSFMQDAIGGPPAAGGRATVGLDGGAMIDRSRITRLITSSRRLDAVTLNQCDNAHDTRRLTRRWAVLCQKRH